MNLGSVFSAEEKRVKAAPFPLKIAAALCGSTRLDHASPPGVKLTWSKLFDCPLVQSTRPAVVPSREVSPPLRLGFDTDFSPSLIVEANEPSQVSWRHARPLH